MRNTKKHAFCPNLMPIVPFVTSNVTKLHYITQVLSARQARICSPGTATAQHQRGRQLGVMMSHLLSSHLSIQSDIFVNQKNNEYSHHLHIMGHQCISFV